MDIKGVLGEIVKDNVINAISKKTGLDEKTSRSLASNALPVLLGALQKNASNPNKKEGLEKAVEKHNGEILENPNKLSLKEGEKILGHIFGDEKENTVKKVGNGKILAALAPIVMSALGKANTKTGKSAGDLLSGDVLSGLTTSFLDKNHNGSIWDDILGMIMKFFRKK